jgi:4-hydroxy-tetrahydrodipicolinate synthase
MFAGCYTALVTPFKNDSIDMEGLEKLIAFQLKNGISGILAAGTTGESPVLSWQEHNQVVEAVCKKTQDKCICIAGTGSNNTSEALTASHLAVDDGADALLLVDPYYNGPSSQEIRKEYVTPIAEAFPDTTIIPYVIPGRTGAQLLPEDLALCYQQFPNVSVVKEATGNLDNMRRTRQCCGDKFTILSGDDGLTLDIMGDEEINGSGVISVLANVAPKAVGDMVRANLDGDRATAQKLGDALGPLFGLVTVTTQEESPFGTVTCRARNPLALKTLMQLLGLPGGPCRRPLGKMSPSGLNVVIEAARTTWSNNPEILQPLVDFFEVDIEARLGDQSLHKELCYSSYERQHDN